MPRGFNEIVLSVSDLQRFSTVFAEDFGWSVELLRDAPREQWSAWRVPEACTRIEQRLLCPDGDRRSALRLVKFHGARQRMMRSSQHAWDTGGIFDIDVYVRDCPALHRVLQGRGWDAFGDPTDYAWGGFEVCEAVMRAPDGICIGLLQPYGKVLIDLPEYRVMSRAFNSAQIVRDYDAGMQFYVERLGWKVLVEAEVQGAEEPGRNVLGVPRPLATTVRRRVAIVHPEGSNDGSLELISMPELEGHAFDPHCVAPNLGYLAARFPHDDARRHAGELQARGVELYAGPIDLVVEPYGVVTTFAVRSPEGAILEFFSPR